uniref:Uncharacterized protein n=1 Tax=Tetradesmus obliquus TaxID=3088 RepID=A0A383V4K5_TETOB|eukprot:jgi/Sobl393_1/12314/SZX59873.1
MHSALQQLVDDSCRRAGKAPWILRDAQGYELVFKAHCSRKGDKGAAAGPHVHVSFTRDDYLRGCELLLASSDPLDARTLSLTTYQAATVSRGDDVRPRHLAELSWRFLGSVGPSQCFAITVMQPPEGGKTLSTRPAYKGIIRAQLPSMCPLGALFRWLATRFAIEGESLPTPGHPQWQSFLLWPGRAGREVHRTGQQYSSR